MLRDDISRKSGRSVAKSTVQPSDRVTHLFQIREDWFEMCAAVREEFAVPSPDREKAS